MRLVYLPSGPDVPPRVFAWAKRLVDDLSATTQVAEAVPLTEGDKGDMIVSGGGGIWAFDPAVVTPFARTFLDDGDAASVRATIGAAAAGALVSSFNGRIGAVTLTAGDVTTALTYTPTSVTGLTGTQSIAAFKTGLSLVKNDVGLGNADNTADAAKNVLSATKLTTARNIDGQAFDGSANITVIAPGTHAATSKATPDDADELPLVDSAASNGLKKLTFANFKATLKTYLDTIYQPIASALTSWASVVRATGFDTFAATPTSANLRALLTDETGTGAAVFAGSPALTGGVSLSGGSFATPTAGTGRIYGSSNGLNLTGLANSGSYDLVFSTGAGNSLLLFRTGAGNAIDVNASVTPLTDNAWTLGDASHRWSAIYGVSFVGALTGNASTATKLATARNINGVAFDGSADITAPPVLTTTEVNLGSIPVTSGNFTIAGSGMTTGKPVLIRQAVGPYTGKGTLADEAEMDSVSAMASVTSATVITAYWNAPQPVAGNFKFDYAVGA